jgi:ABC-type sugar transport system ATPase subunit
MIPEDRRGEGLLVNMTVKENIIMPHLSSLTKGGFTSENKIKDYVKNIIEKFSIKVFSPLQEVRTLSGGNQQKVSVGKWLGENANIWIFDEPTQGIDVDAKTEIYSIMGNIAKEGAGVWFISSDLKELVAISDRIYVMHEFEIVSEFKPPFDKEAILSKMMGEI